MPYLLSTVFFAAAIAVVWFYHAALGTLAGPTYSLVVLGYVSAIYLITHREFERLKVLLHGMSAELIQAERYEDRIQNLVHGLAGDECLSISDRRALMATMKMEVEDALHSLVSLDTNP